jgi:hypothetical protein
MRNVTHSSAPEAFGSNLALPWPFIEQDMHVIAQLKVRRVEYLL